VTKPLAGNDAIVEGGVNIAKVGGRNDLVGLDGIAKISEWDCIPV
jgi:hypothetical protein